MKKKILYTLSFVLVVTLFSFVVHALTFTNDATDLISVTINGQTNKTNYHLDSREVNLNDPDLGYESGGYIGKVFLDVDPGYYVSDFTVTHSKVDHPLKLGFEAGAETGNFFREVPYRADRDEYQFVIPADATESDKVQVNYTVSEKKPIDITYFNYLSDDDSNDAIENPANYDMDHEHVLVSGYKDGDIILPDDCMEKGCVLKFSFDNEADYNEYKSHKITEEDQSWFWADGFIFDEHDQTRTLIADENSCIEDSQNNEYVCYVTVTKKFSEVGNSPLYIGYTKTNIFAPNVTALKVHLDVENFSDVLHETGREMLTFTPDNKEINLEVFYGTKKIYLEQVTPKSIVSTGEQHLGSLKTFDNVTGSGFAYTMSYNSLMKTAIININSYYQDKLELEFNLSKNNEDILSGKAKIRLDRFAFGGNGGQLLEVDSMGRNCHEGSNGNTCNEGVYYSTQYRGIYSFMYVTEEDQETPATIDDEDFYDDFESEVNNLVLRAVGAPNDAHRRNKEFNPHAVALYYDENDEIIFTRDFDLNAEIYKGGIISKDSFDELYGNATISGDTTVMNRDYVRIDRYDAPLIKYIEYFTGNLDESIMHNLVLISKDEVEENHIKKIALFLVNGEIEDDDIPELTYGLGEGRIMEIRGEN